MKRSLTCFVIILWASLASAAPYLAGDPPVELDVVKSRVEYDSEWESAIDIAGCTDKLPGCVWTDPETNIQHYIFRDLAGIPDGAHTFRARWIDDMNREGDNSDPFEYDNQPPGKPSLRLIP